jgi:hypothetical protein
MECKPVKVLIPIGAKLSTNQCLKTQEEEEEMFHVPHVSACYHTDHRLGKTRPNPQE